jgi:hypothetical protein
MVPLVAAYGRRIGSRLAIWGQVTESLMSANIDPRENSASRGLAACTPYLILANFDMFSCWLSIGLEGVSALYKEQTDPSQAQRRSRLRRNVPSGTKLLATASAWLSELSSVIF